jgi:glycosyltransferase involved in cell wall biosynthesis
MKIVHLTSAHPRYDTRIFVKQCQSLAQAGHEVVLVVADGKGNETVQNVRIVDTGNTKGRLQRVVGATRRVVAVGSALRADVYVLHDPELLPFALSLKSALPQGARSRVVFDSHEDVPTQLLNKPYLTPGLLKLISAVYRGFETWVCRRLDGVMAATPHIRDKFLRIQRKTVDINNFPALSEFPEPMPWEDKAHEACYVGGITLIRGAMELVQAMNEVARQDPALRLNLAGAFENEALRLAMQAHAGWAQVNELGFQSRQGVQATLARSSVGLVTLHPTPSYVDALPVKMFEYMAAGIPVVASDFPLWAGIVNDAQCGLCVDPLNPQSIAQALLQLAADPQQAQAMGARGRHAVLNRYNWGHEEAKLLAFVNDLATGQP